jgi:hypothetical protein
MHGDPGPFSQVDVLRPVVSGDVEERDLPPVTFVVGLARQERGIADLKAGFLQHFAAEGLLGGLSFLDGAAEPGPAARMRNLRLVVTQVHEQAVAGHDEQHGGFAHGHRWRLFSSSLLSISGMLFV